MIRSERTNKEWGANIRTRDDVIESLRSHRAELDDFGVRRISLFGSVARGALHADSDVDMIVDFSDVTYRRFVALRALLESILGRKVDLLTPPAVRGRFKETIEKDLVDVPR